MSRNDYFYKKHEEAIKEINKIIENSKVEYRKKIISELSKNSYQNGYYTPNYEATNEIKMNLSEKLDELNILMFEDVTKHYYDLAIKEVKDLIDVEVEEKFDINLLETILASFIVGDGLNYQYKKELERRIEYYNSQMVNISASIINKKINSLTDKYVNNNFISVATSALENGSDEMSNGIISQKKGFMFMNGDVSIYAISAAMLSVYLSAGINEVQRIGVSDGKQCKYCAQEQDKIFNIETAPSLPSHRSCRCYYVPYINK